MKDYEAKLDGDRIDLHGFALDLGATFLRLHSDLVRLHTSPVWVENGTAAGDVELPSMPGTAKNFASRPRRYSLGGVGRAISLIEPRQSGAAW